MANNDKQPQENQRSLKPADEAAPGTPGTGDALCPTCGGSGTVNGRPCADCAGTGVVTQGIGGA